MLLEKTFNPRQDGGTAMPQNNFLNVVGRMRRTAKSSTNFEDGPRHPTTLYVRNRSITINKHDNALLTTKRINEHGEVKKIPKWVENVDKNHIDHAGEAPIFSENFLPSNKEEQRADRGWAAAETTTFFNRRNFANDADRFCQMHRTRNYLLASKAPSVETKERPTRAAILRNTYRSQLQSAAVYNAAKIEHKRKKERPQTQDPKIKWMPTKFQMHEAPNSFLVGTRFNYNHRDIKSFDKIGLYIPRQRPEASFLKTFSGPESEVYHDFARERRDSIRDRRQHETRDQRTSIDYPTPSRRSMSPRASLDRAVRSYLKKRISSNDFQPRIAIHPGINEGEELFEQQSTEAGKSGEKREDMFDVHKDENGFHTIPC